MVLFAIFMCLATPQPGVGQNCIFLSDRPVYGQPGVPYSQWAYTTLAACKRDLAYFEHGKPAGYVNVCLQKTVPAWEPAE